MVKETELVMFTSLLSDCLEYAKNQSFDKTFEKNKKQWAKALLKKEPYVSYTKYIEKYNNVPHVMDTFKRDYLLALNRHIQYLRNLLKNK